MYIKVAVDKLICNLEARLYCIYDSDIVVPAAHSSVGIAVPNLLHIESTTDSSLELATAY